MTINFLEDFLDKSSKFFPELKVVRLSGGEPLLHSKFLKVLEAVKLRGYEIELFTNGVLLQDLEKVGVIGEFTRLYISLHSIDSYEEIFGTSNKDIKEQVLACLRSLDNDVRKRTTLSIVLTRLSRVDDVIGFARSYGFKVNLYLVRNFTHAFELTREICEEVFDPEIEQTIKYNRDVIVSPCQHTMHKLRKAQAKNFSWSLPCSVPFENLILDHSGNIRLCCGDHPPIGKATDIPEIFASQTCRKHLHEANQRLGVCRNCLIGHDPCLKCLTPNQIAGFAKKRIVDLCTPNHSA